MNDNTEQKKAEARTSVSAAPITIFGQQRNDDNSSKSNHVEEVKRPPKEGETSKKNDGLIHTLKMRLVKGEIKQGRVS